ncbi:MAG: 2-dehydropantoate 2-reductase [bacterium]|nr:2-dehydropantoate 2-reductase [bacterium]MDT8395695.1 2-dehydropantoate 2-reductase [bacterium]
MAVALKEVHRRFIIYGAGAIGSVFGGMLAKGGHQVDLVGREEHMEAIRKDGLRIDGLLGEFMVEGVGAFTGLERIDPEPVPGVVFIAVKSSDTARAVQDIARSGIVGDGTLVVSLQNGLGNLESIREMFGPYRSVGGRVIFGAQVTRPGWVHVSVWADSVLIGGPPTGPGVEAARNLAGELTRCGIETRVSENIQAALWGKVLYNAGLNPLSALLEVPYGALGEQENARRLLVLLVEEAFAVASVEETLPWESLDGYLELFFGKLLPATESHYSSMLQDLEAGRETEIEAITGEVIRRGDARGVPVPVSKVVYELIKAKAAMEKRSPTDSGV